MDTFAEISCYSLDRTKAIEATNKAFLEMQRIERLCNRFDDKSEVSKINSPSGKKITMVSEEIFDLIERCIHYSELTNGAFDISVSSMKKGRYKDIILDKKKMSVYLAGEDMKIDLGGVAKGYAVDMAMKILISAGIKNALVNIGGNIFAIGNPPYKDSWRIGIRDPRDRNNVISKLDLKDKAMATSANYERPSHIVDPATGRAIGDFISVTIVTDSAEKADALSTAVFVMGKEKGLEFIESIDSADAFIFP